MGKGRPPTSGSIRHPDHAAKLAQLSKEARTARKAGAPAGAPAGARQALPQALAGAPAGAPVSPYANPQLAAGAAQANALADLFRLWRVAASLRIHRLAPVWARGYLEDTDQATVDSAGGLHRYLADTWGGDRYRVELVDASGAPMGPGWTLAIRGPVRSWGRVEVEPAGYSAPVNPSAPPPPYLATPPAPAGPVAAPAANPSPAASGLTPAERVELVQLVRRLAEQLDAAQREIGRLRDNPPAASSPAPADPGAVFRDARAILAAAREFADEVDSVSGKPPPAELEDSHSPFAKEIMRGLARKIGEGMFPAERPAGGNGSAHAAEPAPSSSAPTMEAEIVE